MPTFHSCYQGPPCSQQQQQSQVSRVNNNELSSQPWGVPSFGVLLNVVLLRLGSPSQHVKDAVAEFKLSRLSYVYESQWDYLILTFT